MKHNLADLPVSSLNLDLRNYRTVPQGDEAQAVAALIAVSGESFWELTRSLLDDGYRPVENIVVLKSDDAVATYTVKEGNRRVAALKLALGEFDITKFPTPDDIRDRIKALAANWKGENSEVPCLIYPDGDQNTVTRIVSLTHARGQKAGRDEWNPVARARFERQELGRSAPGLSLLEEYLKHGENLTAQEKRAWAGAYPLSNLDDIVGQLAQRVGYKSSKELATLYPNVNYKSAIDDILRDLGTGKLGALRSKGKDFFASYGIPDGQGAPSSGTQRQGSASTTGTSGSGSSSGTSSGSNSSSSNSSSGTSATGSNSGQATPGQGGQGSTSRKKTAAVSPSDPRSVKRALKKLVVRGNNRGKVVDLRAEAIELNPDKTPLAFCFVLRSMFEISAKAYCQDQAAAGGPSMMKSNGKDPKTLAEALKDISDYISGINPNISKELLAAKTELAKSDGILSITSLNQLVHNPSFHILSSDLCKVFANVFPLLREMNA